MECLGFWMSDREALGACLEPPDLSSSLACLATSLTSRLSFAMSQLQISVAQVRVGVGAGEEDRRRRSTLASEAAPGDDVDAARARSAVGFLADKTQAFPDSGSKPSAGGMVLRVWQEGGLTPEQQTDALQQMLVARERQVAGMQRKLEAKESMQQELGREHERLRNEYLAVQLELKVAHETSWTCEGNCSHSRQGLLRGIERCCQ